VVPYEDDSRREEEGGRRGVLAGGAQGPPAPFWEAYGYVANDSIVQYSRNLGEESNDQ